MLLSFYLIDERSISSVDARSDDHRQGTRRKWRFARALFPRPERVDGLLDIQNSKRKFRKIWRYALDGIYVDLLFI